ncbi:MAG TPA: hypothetical protein VIN06_04835 [Devosia sp.]
MDSRPANEIEAAIAAQRFAEQCEALLLEVFAADELAAIPAELRPTLDMLLRRRLRQDASEPTVGELLVIRQQFEQFCDHHLALPGATRLAQQLR